MSLATMGCPPGQKTVLVIEDSRAQAAYLRQWLEEVELCVICAYDGSHGLQIAHESQPDLIVLDVQMPEMNGFQVCQQLHGSWDTAEIPVIMFTTHDDPEVIALGEQIGVVGFIPKGAFAIPVLMETLRQIGFIDKVY
ncbi:MAG: response regulator [Anaerolineae bacterium]|nr:response regulator [Anaerolineae bacterium]